MKGPIVYKIVLCIAGIIAIGIGGAILISPIDFFASNQIDIGNNASLLSEIRAPAGALLACGILILSGVFVSKLTYTSLIVSSLVYLSYGISRIIGIKIDGMPSDSLVYAAVFEIFIGLVCMFFLLKYTHKQ